MALFLPLWVTTDRTLATITEGEEITYTLVGDEVLTVRGATGQFALTVGGHAGRLDSFTVNGVETPYHTVGTEIQFEALAASALIKASAIPVLTFTLIKGALPPGLMLNKATGVISGIVGGGLGSEEVFEFTIRIANAYGYSDRTFAFVTPQLFVPLWLTPAGALPAVTEGDTVNFQFECEELLKTTVLEGQFFVNVGPDASTVTRVLMDSVSIPFTILGNTVRFAPTTNQTADLQIYASPTLTYSVINGSLPTGLLLNATTGVLSGVVGNVIGSPVFEFTVRLDNGGQVRDRTFTIATSSLVSEATINTALLPPLDNDADLGLVYYPLAQTKRANALAIQFDVYDPDQTSPTMVVRSQTGLPDTGEDFGGLPPGLTLDGYTINGTIEPDAPAGRYFFDIRLIVDDITVDEVKCMIDVLLDVEDVADTVPELTWVTPPGALGFLNEGEKSTFRVVAAITTTDPLTYTLSPHSAPMPYGLHIDTTTGNILGQARHVSTDTESSFTIRVSGGGLFADRTFSIIVRSLYTSDNVVRLFLRAYESESEPLMSPYPVFIPSASIYRPDDPQFGLRTHAESYVIGGLDGSKDFQAAISDEGVPSIGPTKDYHGPLSLILGSHRLAVARDSNGDIAYEVIYRPLYDPQAKAGGFDFSRNDPVDERVLYPQLRDPHYVFPVSLHNIRYDLANDIGFPSRDPALAKTLGVDGVEALPLWMRSEQVSGVATSVLGFVPAIPICYLKPGTGRAVLNSLIKNAALLENNGKVLHFDKYFVTSDILVNTLSLDNDATLFDVNTSFDGNSNVDTIS